MAWPTWSPDLNPLHIFLWSLMKSQEYHSGNPEARYQLVEAIVHIHLFMVYNYIMSSIQVSMFQFQRSEYL